jgi:hypothetical protein
MRPLAIANVEAQILSVRQLCRHEPPNANLTDAPRHAGSELQLSARPSIVPEHGDIAREPQTAIERQRTSTGGMTVANRV